MFGNVLRQKWWRCTNKQNDELKETVDNLKTSEELKTINITAY